MCVKINVKVATSSVKYGGFPLNILLILLKMKINNDHFFKLHIFKYHDLVFWLFILTGHILVKTLPSSLPIYLLSGLKCLLRTNARRVNQNVPCGIEEFYTSNQTIYQLKLTSSILKRNITINR